MKKIAVVVQRYGNEVNGGAELEAKEYAERLTEYYDVTVLTTCAKDYVSWKNEYPEGEERINGVRVLRFACDEERDGEEFHYVRTRMVELLEREETEIDEAFQQRWLRKQGPYCPKLVEQIKKDKDEYDVFLFMTYLYYPTVCGIAEVKEKSILIPTAHDEPYIRIPCYRSIFNGIKGLFYNSSGEKKLVDELFDVKDIPCAIGGCGVSVPENIDMEAFKERYHLPDEYVVYAGRVDVEKGCKDLIAFWKDYNKERRLMYKAPVTLVLIGKVAMEMKPVHHVISLGFVSDEDKYAAIAGAMFMVLPSPMESLSIAVLESFSLRRPVLVNGNCMTLRDHVLLSNGGLFYQDYDEFTVCMDYLTDPDRKKEIATMGKNGKFYCLSNYEWNGIIKRLVQLIEG
ncbi:MAG: glycosyltransferase family 4 protein [Clostridiales bacterium]|nr:glycosyltransferase family 4 protein [Clostridiales bacterium]